MIYKCVKGTVLLTHPVHRTQGTVFRLTGETDTDKLYIYYIPVNGFLMDLRCLIEWNASEEPLR